MQKWRQEAEAEALRLLKRKQEAEARLLFGRGSTK